MEAAGSDGGPVMPQFKFALSHVAEDGSTDDVGKMALVSPKSEKGELFMGSMEMLGLKSKDYSATTEEYVSLVGKSTGMLETISGGFTSQIAGWSNEVGSPTMILRQEATKGTGLARPIWSDICG